MPGRRPVDTGEHEMHDIFGEVVLAGGNEDFRSRNLVAAVGLRRGPGANQPEVGAALRFGQVHGARPLPGNKLGQVNRFLFWRCVCMQRGDGALGEARIHGKRHIRRTEKFIHRLGQHHRQTLAAKFGRRRQSHPAAAGKPPIGVLKTRRRRDRPVVVAAAAFFVADAVERGQHLFGKLGRLGKHRLDDVGAGLGESGQVVMALDMEHVAQQERHVVDGSPVARHDILPVPRLRHGARGSPAN